MLSDRGIMRAVEEGRLIIDPFEPLAPSGTNNLGNCSYNLTAERFYELHDNIFFEQLPYHHSEMESFLQKYADSYRGVMRPDKCYIGKSKELVMSSSDFTVTTRSSAARLGIDIHDSHPERQRYLSHYTARPQPVYFTIRTFATVQVPEGSKIAQIEFAPGFYLQGEEFLQVVKTMTDNGTLTLLSDLGSRGSGIVLHCGNKIRLHNGRLMIWGQNNDHCFSDIDVTKPFHLYKKGFCLVPSLEYVHMPHDHAGWLWDMNRFNGPFNILPEKKPNTGFVIHPNAPLIAPGSKGNQIHEVWHNLNYYETWERGRIDVRPQGLYIEAGLPISIMTLHPLDQTTEPYKGKYAGQTGAQTSLSHLD